MILVNKVVETRFKNISQSRVGFDGRPNNPADAGQLDADASER